ncbi:Transposon Tf2-9 polyprotein [Dictyocoela muelleri]|nr:Transposon Tf2-9 polyprotein [Dictyocoela muelleri]
MYRVIDETEVALIEQLTVVPRRNKEHNKKRYDVQLHRKSGNESFCSFHKTSKHDNTNCRAQKRQREYRRSTNSETETQTPKRNTMICEPRVIDQTLEIEGIINDNKYKFLLDTGSVFSYIDESIALENKIPIYEIPTCTAVLVDGSKIETSREAVIEMALGGDKTTIYKPKVGILSNMSLHGILGMDFLIQNDARIDLSEGIITLDNKHYELSLNKSLNEFDKKLSNKTYINAHGEENIQNKARDLIKTYNLKNSEIGEMKETEHKIILNQQKVINQPSYRISPKMKNILDKEIDYLLENKIIQKSVYNYNSPAFPILKSNGRIRLVIDYRKLNEITIKTPYIFPAIQEIMTQLHKAKIFSKIDLNLGYYQIPIENDSIKYTAFSINNQKYEFRRMPFGLSNAPSTFQLAMEKIFGTLSYVKVYLDDILIHSETLNDHYQHLKSVFKMLHENSLSINFDKSEFFRNEVKFLGHIVSENGIKPCIDRIEPLKKITPKNKRHIQRILGIINWYRNFIKDASKKTLFLTKKLSKETNFSWNNQDQYELNEIMREIESQALLKYPDPNSAFKLETDASKEITGGVLSQTGKPIGFYSYKLSKTELNYSITEKETLALLKALFHFKPIFFNSKVIVYTDNKNIIPDKPLPNREERWKILLQEFDLEIKHIEGKENFIADSLSRINFISENSLIKINWEELRRCQESDKKLLDKIEDNSYSKNEQNLIVDKSKRIIIPENYKFLFFTQIHNDLLHPGIKRTYMTIKNYFNSMGLKKTITQIIKSCQLCHQTKKQF